jgi:hypothetical protein
MSRHNQSELVDVGHNYGARPTTNAGTLKNAVDNMGTFDDIGEATLNYLSIYGSPEIILYLNFIRGPDQSIKITSLTILNQSNLDVAVRYVSFMVYQNKSDLKTRITNQFSYVAYPKPAIGVDKQNTFLGINNISVFPPVESRSSIGKIDLIPSGNNLNPNNTFNKETNFDIIIRLMNFNTQQLFTPGRYKVK